MNGINTPPVGIFGQNRPGRIFEFLFDERSCCSSDGIASGLLCARDCFRCRNAVVMFNLLLPMLRIHHARKCKIVNAQKHEERMLNPKKHVESMMRR